MFSARMRMKNRFFPAVLMAAALLAAWAAPLAAQPYPARPLKLIVPYPPGGGGDLVGRYFAQKLSDSLGMSVLVDNRGGAGGNIGTDAGAKAAPDGYTLTLATNGVAINHTLYPKIPFDIIKDFAPISMLGSTPMLVLVHPSVPARSITELIALEKAKPGALNHGTAGIGSPQHLAAELFNNMTGTRLVHVPFRGTCPSLQALVSNDIQVMFATMASVEQFVRNGTVRALAVTEATRFPVFPDLPTVAEAGVPGYSASVWYALLAPARTPEPALARLNADLKLILAQPETRAKLAAQGTQAAFSTPAGLGKTIRDDATKWGEVIKRLNLSANE